MPKYVFECQTTGCDLRFERTLKMGDHSTHECPNCHDLAPQVIAGFSFGFKAPENAPPGNTGVTKDDYPTADHLVGKDAEKRWGQYAAKETVKAEARKAGGTHALIRRTAADGSHIEYDPMTPGGRVARRNLAKKAIKTLQETGPRSR